MAQNRCRLSKKGEKARDELLELLYPGRSYNDSQLEKDTELDRGSTIPKILGKKKENLNLTKIEQFFEKLLRKVRNEAEKIKVEKYLEDNHLTACYDKIWSDDDRFYLPKNFYCCQNQQPKPAPSPRTKQELSNLFWHLDYQTQRQQFENALGDFRQSVAFSIFAPCDTTQRWLLNRLIRLIPNYQNALILPAFGLRQHPMRYSFAEFWQDLSQYLKTPAQPSAIVNQLCHGDVNRPIIITIYEFHQSLDAQRLILQEFWEPLRQQLEINCQRDGRSRIVLFFVDRCHLEYTSPHLVNLDALAISQKDVEIWLDTDLVAQCWKVKGKDFPKQLMKEASEENWNWQDPWFIIDRICYKFDLQNGVNDIAPSWKWNHDYSSAQR